LGGLWCVWLVFRQLLTCCQPLSRTCLRVVIFRVRVAERRPKSCSQMLAYHRQSYHDDGWGCLHCAAVVIWHPFRVHTTRNGQLHLQASHSRKPGPHATALQIWDASCTCAIAVARSSSRCGFSRGPAFEWQAPHATAHGGVRPRHASMTLERSAQQPAFVRHHQQQQHLLGTHGGPGRAGWHRPGAGLRALVRVLCALCWSSVR
jgi:hypothetical protein